MAVDRSGNIYIITAGNSRIRKIDQTGTITTIAGIGQSGFAGDGGPASLAKLHWPSGIAVDDSGNIFFTEYGNCLGRKIDPGGIITTVAGNGQGGYSGDGGPATAASLFWPVGLAIDAIGNIYISDTTNHRIRKVDAKGIISTLAGTGQMSYGGDGLPPGQASFSFPRGVAVDPSGTIFINDSENSRIRKISYPEAFQASITAGEIAFVDTQDRGYILSSSGVHQSTIDLKTGKVLLAFGYDSTGRLVSITDPFGNQTTIQREGQGNPISITSPFGILTRLTVDSNNHLTAVAYADNSAYEFQYTSDGLLTDKVDPKQNRFRQEFDGFGLVTNVLDPEGGIWNYSRSVDVSGKAQVLLGTAEGNTTTFEDRTDFSGAYFSRIISPTGLVGTFSRSGDGLAESEQPFCGLSLTLKYDLDQAYRYKYLKEFTQRSPSGLTRTRTETRAYQDTNGDGLPDFLTRTSVVNGRNWVSTNNTRSGVLTSTSPQGRTIGHTYDPANLLLLTTTVSGKMPIGYGYDPKGRLISTTQGARISALTYDPRGNIESQITSDGKTLRYTYDSVGRLKTQVLPDTTVIAYEYDANGNMTVLTNPRLIAHGFDYNGVNLRKTMTMPFSGSYQYLYDKERNPKSVTFPSGKQIVNTYTGGLLRATTSPEGITNFSYGCSSLLGEVSMGTEKVTYGYDGSLLTSDTRTGTLNQVIRSGYNNDFRLMSLGYAGVSQSFSYDNDGLLTGAGSFTITRNSQNGLPESVSDGILINTRTFNGYGEQDGIFYSIGGANKYSYNLTRDLSGRITQKVETLDGASDTYNYGYDTNGRLMEVNKNNLVIESYTYDPNGNRLTEINTLRGVNRSYTVSTEDHVVTAGNETHQFDVDGFLTQKTSPAGTMATIYSSRCELQSATLPNGTVITYDHDPLGRRIAKKVNGTITEKYLWKDAITLLAVYDGNDSLIMRFTYADGRMPVSMTYNGSTYYLAYDQLGSLRAVINISGNIIKKIDYDSFGSIILDTNPAMTVPFGFAGGLHDWDTNLVRFGARDYDPTLGRWTAKDPIDFAGGDANLYGYVQNNPVNYTDLTGLQWFPIITRGGGKGILSGGPGAMIGGITGAFIGAGLGTATGIPGMGLVGGMVLGMVGGQIGGLFDNPCAGQLNCNEPLPPKPKCP